MENLRKRLKTKALKKNVKIKDAINSFIHPFKEMPSLDDTGKENVARINAHDLFSFFTADIIKENVLFSR